MKVFQDTSAPFHVAKETYVHSVQLAVVSDPNRWAPYEAQLAKSVKPLTLMLSDKM